MSANMNGGKSGGGEGREGNEQEMFAFDAFHANEYQHVSRDVLSLNL